MDKIIDLLKKFTPLSKEEISSLIEIPPNQELGDYAFPCFVLSKTLKKSPNEIAHSLAEKINSKEIKAVASGPYLNFFLDESYLVPALEKIRKEKEKYGSENIGKNQKILIDMSSPNIAKPFGIGHLRSTIIGNSISKISEFLGFKTIKINYLGDWGTQFGKLITAYKKFGDEKKLKKNPIKYMLELYIIGNKEEYEDEARNWLKKLENRDKEALKLWKIFRELSIKEFDKIYSLLNIKFDEISGESVYYSEEKTSKIINELSKKNLLKKSENAAIVDLQQEGLGIGLIKKADNTTLYLTRDLAAAIDRHSKYKFKRMFYEVGSEQRLHFKQLFKILELLGYTWAKECVHIEHGLYLDKDGKKFATREGKTIFMEDILNETINLAQKEIMKREKLKGKDLESRALAIALAAIIYGDLKNFRANDIIFDVERFLSFEGNTGPYLLYTYARAKSLLRNAKYSYKKPKIPKNLNKMEKYLLLQLSDFPKIVKKSYKSLSPNLIANFAFQIAQTFNEYYQSEKIIGAENQDFKLSLASSFSQVLKNSLELLGISVIERM